MTIRNTFLVSAAMAQPAMAQAAPAAQASFTAGAKVSDTAGGAVGTITSVEGDFVTLKTNKHEVRLPKSSFTAVKDGFIMAMTQAQVNAAVDQSLAKAEALVAVGAMVRDTSGGMVGPIQEMDAQFVTLKLPNALVKLPRSAVAATPRGPVIAMTAAELTAQSGATATGSATADATGAEGGAGTTAGADAAAASTTDTAE